MCLCSLSTNKDYKNHTFLNLTGKVQSCGKWIKTQAMIDSGCTSKGLIDTEYVKKHHLNIQKLEHNMPARDFNEKMTWITHYVLVKLWFGRHVEYIQLLLHDLKEDYNLILRFQWLKLHNLLIDWIDKTVKFSSQYCQSNCLHKLSWYVHTHDYTNMTQYELLMPSSTMLSHNNKQPQNHMNKKKFEKDFFRISSKNENDRDAINLKTKLMKTWKFKSMKSH